MYINLESTAVSLFKCRYGLKRILRRILNGQRSIRSGLRQNSPQLHSLMIPVLQRYQVKIRRSFGRVRNRTLSSKYLTLTLQSV